MMNQDIYVVIEHLRGKVSEISYVMLAAADKLAHETGGKVTAIIFGQNAQDLFANIKAEKIFYADHALLAEFNPEAYQRVLFGIIKENSPRAVFFGHTTIGMDIVGGISAHLELPLISSVRSVETGMKVISQICGGKIMAESNLPESTTLITMVPGGYKPEQGQSNQTPQVISIPVSQLDDLRVKLNRYIEPETSDVDITKEPFLIAVGRGIQTQDNISLAEELAQALGGVVCASRPVVDQGWLPTSRLVGKSGSTVKPKIYLAIGISGAPEHVEAITGSDVIIGINTDPNAPIFNIAKYGTTADLFDLVPVLTDLVRSNKG
jgi:electron transfer flavoprotein alpha subunit